MGEAKNVAPTILMWSFQHLRQPSVQYAVELEFRDVQMEQQQQESMEKAFDGGNRQGLAILVSRPLHYRQLLGFLTLALDHTSEAHLQVCQYHDPSLSP